MRFIFEILISSAIGIVVSFIFFFIVSRINNNVCIFLSNKGNGITIAFKDMNTVNKMRRRGYVICIPVKTIREKNESQDKQ